MVRPRPTVAMHFTSIDNLPSVTADGMCSDVLMRRQARAFVELGDSEIKERRRTRCRVDCGPGGLVGEYVPFYFAPVNSMVYRLVRNDGKDFSRVAYLVTSLERLSDLGLPFVVSDRNAAKDLAEFVPSDGDLDSHVDWPLMQSSDWGRHPDFPGRPERRMAECLVHERVPWEAIERIVLKTAAAGREVSTLIEGLAHRPPVTVLPRWYV